MSSAPNEQFIQQAERYFVHRGADGYSDMAVFWRKARAENIERWLVRHGWQVVDYPINRGTSGYRYTVYAHLSLGPGVWTMKAAVEKTFKLGLKRVDVI